MHTYAPPDPTKPEPTTTSTLTIAGTEPGDHLLIMDGQYRGHLVERVPNPEGCGCKKKWPRVRVTGFVEMDGATDSGMPPETGVRPDTVVARVRMR